MDTLIKKLDAEYEMFFLKMQSESKATIFARSKEIETKKRIYCYLRRVLDDDKNAPLKYQENILDAIYVKVEDKDDNDALNLFIDASLSDITSKLQEKGIREVP